MSTRSSRLAALADDPLWRWVLPAALTALAAVLLFVRLDEPARIIFDEVYYVGDARAYLQTGVEDGFAVHPPVGKWLIAASIALFGDVALGWRALGALAGALTVLLTYRIGLRLFHHVGVAALAGLLLATDGLFLVQARTTMLDIYLAFFIALGAWLLLADHDRSGLAAFPPDPPDPPNPANPANPPDLPERPVPAGGSEDAEPPVGLLERSVADPADSRQPPRGGLALPRRGHLLRVLAGVAFGLAIATKWSGLLALGAAGLLALGWELQLRKRWLGTRWARLGPMLGSVAVALVLVPTAVYVLSYVPWLMNYADTHTGEKECGDQEIINEPCDVGLPGRLAGLWRYQVEIARFHEGLDATHPYRAPATTWPVLARPVVYYWETCSEDRAAGVPSTDPDTGEVTEPEPCVVAQGQAAEIIAVGNPVLWWGFLAASPLLLAGLVRRRRDAAFIATFYAAQFLPWLIVSRPVFFFYMVPVVPFLALGLAHAVAVAGRRWPTAVTYVGAAIGGVTGFAAGFALSRLTDAETTTGWWLGMAAGWVLGALLGAGRDRRRVPSPLWARRQPATTLGTVIAVLAVALLLWFWPVWTGIPMSEDAVRRRWWFPGWI